MDQHLLGSSLLVPPHLRPVEPSTLAPRARPPGHTHREYINSVRDNEDQPRPDSCWISANMHCFPEGGVLVYYGMGSAVRLRHGTVFALNSSCDACFTEAQDAVDDATDQRRCGNIVLHDYNDV